MDQVFFGAKPHTIIIKKNYDWSYFQRTLNWTSKRALMIQFVLGIQFFSPKVSQSMLALKYLVANQLRNICTGLFWVWQVMDGIRRYYFECNQYSNLENLKRLPIGTSFSRLWSSWMKVVWRFHAHLNYWYSTLQKTEITQEFSKKNLRTSVNAPSFSFRKCAQYLCVSQDPKSLFYFATNCWAHLRFFHNEDFATYVELVNYAVYENILLVLIVFKSHEDLAAVCSIL